MPLIIHEYKITFFSRFLKVNPFHRNRRILTKMTNHESLYRATPFWGGGGGLTVTYTLSVLHRIGGVPSVQFLNRLCCIETLSKVI